MGKTIIGALVGGLLIFIWQFISWGPGSLHRSAQEYTPKQDSILAYLSSQFSEDGAYFMPTYPQGTTSEEMQKIMDASKGKPWAQVYYHKELKIDMLMNMIRGFLVNIVLAWLFIWLIGKLSSPSFGKIFSSALAVGVIVFLNTSYTMHIWYHSFDLYAHLADALVSWALVGIWLGWWLTKKK